MTHTPDIRLYSSAAGGWGAVRSTDKLVDLETVSLDAVRRVARRFKVVAQYDMLSACAACYAGTNGLMPLHGLDRQTRTATSKSTSVRISHSEAAETLPRFDTRTS